MTQKLIGSLSFVSLYLLATLFSALAVQKANVTPIIAKQRTTESRILPDGTEQVIRTSYGRLLRASNGNELQVDGTPTESDPPTSALYRDMASGKEYRLNYKTKTARETPLRGDRPPEVTAEYAANARRAAIREDIVNGLPCLVFPVINGSDGTQNGTGCWSLDHALRVKSVWETSGPGYKLRVVNELYDIQVGVEPDLGLVGIPEGFSISK